MSLKKTHSCPRGSLLFWSERPFHFANIIYSLKIEEWFFKRQKSDLCAKPAEVIPFFLVQEGEEAEICNLQRWHGGEPISHLTPVCFLLNVSTLNPVISNCCCLIVQHPNLGKTFVQIDILQMTI